MPSEQSRPTDLYLYDDVEFDPVYAATSAEAEKLGAELRAALDQDPGLHGAEAERERERVTDELTGLWLAHQRAQDALQDWYTQQLAAEMLGGVGRFYDPKEYYQRGDAFNLVQAKAAIERTDEYGHLREAELHALEAYTRARHRLALRYGGAL